MSNTVYMYIVYTTSCRNSSSSAVVTLLIRTTSVWPYIWCARTLLVLTALPASKSSECVWETPFFPSPFYWKSLTALGVYLSFFAMYTCRCNSCLMVFTVYGICTVRRLYVLLRVEPEEVHTAQGRYYPVHCKNHETADLYR